MKAAVQAEMLLCLYKMCTAVMSCLSTLQEAVIKVFTDKVPKVVVAAVDVVTSALRWVVKADYFVVLSPLLPPCPS